LKTGSLDTIAYRMDTIHVPILVLVGNRDSVLTEALQRREVLPLLPQATLQIIPGVGHLAPLENPTATAQAILLFLLENHFPKP